MVRRNKFFALAAVGLALGACSPPAGNDAGTDAPTSDTPVTGDTGPGQTYTYVVNQLKLDTRLDNGMEVLDTSAANPHTGFNVDNRFSDTSDTQGCTIPDYYSKFDTDQHMPAGCSPNDATCKGGVDNQLLSVAEALSVAVGDINALAKENIDQNKLVLLVRVSDVNSLTTDADVTVRLYLGYPTFTTGCTTVTAGRTYKVAASSLMPGATSLDQALFTFTGKIEAGRLQVSRAGRFDLPLPPIMGQTLQLSLNNTNLRAGITATEGTQGNIGGWVKGLDIRATVAAIAPGQLALVDSLLPTFLDVVDPTNTATPMDQCIAASGQPPAKWGGISVGFGISMINATLDPTPAAAAAAGVCGNQGGGGG